MVIKLRQLALRLGIALAFVILFAGIFLLLPRHAAESEDILLAADAAREAWLNLRGWEVGEPVTAAAQMPETWQTVRGQQWFTMQHAQGLSPERFAGMEITRYIYPLTDDESGCKYAELWLCGDVLAGAMIYDASSQLMAPVL